ncbi:MAG: hypothetical protein RL468_2297 [Pseudomonadota bacterium]
MNLELALCKNWKGYFLCAQTFEARRAYDPRNSNRVIARIFQITVNPKANGAISLNSLLKVFKSKFKSVVSLMEHRFYFVSWCFVKAHPVATTV